MVGIEDPPNLVTNAWCEGRFVFLIPWERGECGVKGGLGTGDYYPLTSQVHERIRAQMRPTTLMHHDLDLLEG
jgi:hypothetical protein